jgi:hypothetical protein
MKKVFEKNLGSNRSHARGMEVVYLLQNLPELYNNAAKDVSLPLVEVIIHTHVIDTKLTLGIDTSRLKRLNIECLNGDYHHHSRTLKKPEISPSPAKGLNRGCNANNKKVNSTF